VKVVSIPRNVEICS